MDRATALVAQDDLTGAGDPKAQALPVLTADQALYISYYMETLDLAKAREKFQVDTATEAPWDLWVREPDFRTAMQMAQTDRRALFRALSLALMPKAFRSLGAMMDNPKSVGKAIELVSRLNGMLIDKVQNTNPDALAELLTRIRSREPYTLSSGESADVSAV